MVDNGKLTNFIFNSLAPKSILRIEGPKGSFFLREESECPIIFIAGGTGFGPVKAIIEHLINIGSKRKVYLYWGVRSEVDLYSNLPSEWSEKYPNISFIPVLSEANETWDGNKGYVHDSVIKDFEDLTGFEVYACGPPVMVNAAAKLFAEELKHIHALAMHTYSPEEWKKRQIAPNSPECSSKK